MITLRKFLDQVKDVPASVAWYLSDLGEALGKQQLFTQQSPQKLRVLREHALIESAVSSNRIEGVVVDPSRVKAVLFGKSRLRDRSEEEIRGYRSALDWIHSDAKRITISEKTILRLHQLIRGDIADAGKYRKVESDIIQKLPDGRARVRLKTVPFSAVPSFTKELITLWKTSLQERTLPPLVLPAAFNLDFFCIHPFRDGNGRVSRLLLLLQCYHLGLEVGRYISLERLIEENKERYYETLEQSSAGWHEGKHDPWQYVNYLLYILKTAYREFENRVGQIASPRGAKTELVIDRITKKTAPFRFADLRQECPGVGTDLIRRILKDLRAAGRVECLGRGQNAQWRKVGKWK